MDEKQKPNQQTPAPQNKPSLIDDSVDTSKEGVRDYLETAAEKISTKDNKVPWHGGLAHKVGFLTMVLDIAKLTGEHRKQVAAKVMKTPAWFGCNASQGRQAYEQKTVAEKVLGFIDEI
jgi:hypothetical protein